MTDVIIGGVGMIPFAKPGKSESYERMGGMAARLALQDAGVSYASVEQAYAGYVFGDSCCGQAALYEVGITGIPIFNVNNNCASGSSAFALATQAVQSGAVDCALAVGFEQMQPGALNTAFPDRASPVARHMEAVARMLDLNEQEIQMDPAIVMFGCQAELLVDRYGVSHEALASIAVKARRHAANSPYAIFRDPLTVEEIQAMPFLYRGLKKLYACPPSCGAAATVICSEAFANKHGIRSDIRLIGKGWSSDEQANFESDPLDVMFRAVSKRAAALAYEDAGLGPQDIDVVELHDCFTSNEAITYAALGLCAEEDIDRFILEGQNTYGGGTVCCPSGGLLAKGHPLGATGLAQITELVWQLRGEADKRQVEGARTALQHNGGLGSAGFVHIFQRAR